MTRSVSLTYTTRERVERRRTLRTSESRAYVERLVELGLRHDDVDEVLATGERRHRRQPGQESNEEGELFGVDVDEHLFDVFDEQLFDLLVDDAATGLEHDGQLGDEELDGALADLLELGRGDLIEDGVERD